MNITVIIPVYNTEKYISQCLDSIINQTYKVYEIIVIDDGSTDSSLAICQEYAKRNKNIRLLHSPNKGVSAARNMGMNSATGDYISFVDSDDWLESDAIEILVELIEDEQVDMSAVLRKTDISTKDNIYVGYGEEALLYVLNNNSIEAWGKLYKKDIFEKIKYAEGSINEDLYILPEIVLQCKKIAIRHIGKYNYRQREDGIMGNELKSGSKSICSCCILGVRKAKEIASTREFKENLQKWYYYHILWYFYNIYCNCDCNSGLVNISSFYKKSIVEIWGNSKIKVSDKLRFSFIALCPQLVKKYNVFRYGEK